MYQFLQHLVKRIYNHPEGVPVRDAPAVLKGLCTLLGELVQGNAAHFKALDDVLKNLEGDNLWTARQHTSALTNTGEDSHNPEISSVRGSKLAKVIATHPLKASGFLASVVLSWSIARDLDDTAHGNSRTARLGIGLEALQQSASFLHFYQNRYALLARVAAKTAQNYSRIDLEFKSLENLTILTLFAHSELGPDIVSNDTESAAPDTNPLQSKRPYRHKFARTQEFATEFLKHLEQECAATVSSPKRTATATTTATSGNDQEDVLPGVDVLLPRIVKAMYILFEILENNANLIDDFNFQVPRTRLIRVCSTLYYVLLDRLHELQLQPLAATKDEYVT